MRIDSPRTGLVIAILGCVMVLFGLPVIWEGVLLDGLAGGWDPHTIVFGIVPLALGLWCLRSLLTLKAYARRGERLKVADASHAFGIASLLLFGFVLVLYLVIGPTPETDFVIMVLVPSSALTGVVSVVLAVTARWSRAPGPPRAGKRGWVAAALLLAFYGLVGALNLRFHGQLERYRATERALIRNGLILELAKRRSGSYPLPENGAAMAAGVKADGWGGPILYSRGADGQHYELVSPGANGTIEPRASASPADVDIGDDLDQDVVFADGEFRRYRWGGWCGEVSLQELPEEDLEDWLLSLRRAAP